MVRKYVRVTYLGSKMGMWSIDYRNNVIDALFQFFKFLCLLFAKTVPCFLAQIPAFAANALFYNSENSPHSRFDIPLKASRAVKIIAWGRSVIFQFHIKGVSNADGTLEWNHPG